MRLRFIGLVLLVSLPALAARPYRGGAVATLYPPATRAAMEILNKGGNAIDAAVAAAFTAGVVGSYHNGLGGGGFALVHVEKSHRDFALDFREVAPLKATPTLYQKDGKVVPGLSTDGALSIGVPGAAAGYLALLDKYGTLPRKVVLAPAIRLAREGYWVSPKYRHMAKMRLSCLRSDEEASRIFLRPNARGVPDVPALGVRIRQPELAKTLRALAAHGAKAFYSGRIAHAIVRTIQKKGGILSLKDLARYHARWRAPLVGSYRGHRIASMGPPSAGGFTILQVLGQLEALDPKGFPFRTPESVHLLAEAMRRSYVDRAKYLGDPSAMKVSAASLLTQAHIEKLAKSIDPHRATPSASLLDVMPAANTEPHHTTHISVIDRKGNAVALTTTVNYGFGSCIVAKGTGVLLNDEMDDFAAKPNTANVYALVTGQANAVGPGKTPLSSMSPTLVFQEGHPHEVMLAIGAPGGPTIPTSTLQVIVNVIDHHMPLPRAVTEGRVHNQFMPDALMVEPFALEPATARALEAMGHHLKQVHMLGEVEAVEVDPKTHLRYAMADPRSEGSAAGQE